MWGSKKSNQETAGEDLIADFLEDKVINFKRYRKIPNLSDDNKFFREADFYLPDYKVYIEFLGQWNDPEHKKRYKQKMAVYHKNKIPCIYLWPDNLGTLDWMIRRRLREVLLKYDKRLLLLKYEWENFTSEYGLTIAVFIAILYFVKHTGWRIGISIFFLYTLYTWINKYYKRLKKLRKSKWVSGKGYNKDSNEE